MFVVSIKSDKLKIILALCLVTTLAVIGGLTYVSMTDVVPASKIGGVVMKAETPEERIAFFSQFGWKIDEEPSSVKEIVIPTEFDSTYNSYNEIQKAQGLDLEPFKGVRVKQWCYKIRNYPGYENSDGLIQGTILIYNGVVVGGDVCSLELDGFMHGFSK